VPEPATAEESFVNRFKWLTIFACLTAAVVVPQTAGAADRMYIGFQDDPSFRFRDARDANLDQARAANATIIRSQVTWAQIAPTKPANPTNPFDPAYAHLSDVDEFVRAAQRRGMEVLLTIYGTPSWANGGKKPNSAPTNVSDLTDFARALAARYSGRYPGYPYVRFFSVWNEPNLDQFLTPQFGPSGNDVAPALYAKIYKAAYAGIKAGNSKALVGIGETSARGHDKPTKGTVQDSHSPGKFVRLVAKADHSLRFDAWAEHPYPFTPSQPPTARVQLPNVSLSQIGDFQKLVDKAFGRHGTPIWVTEYSHETKPQDPRGVSYATQAAYAKTAFGLAKANPAITMFIWFVLRDDPSDPWQSGLLDESGSRKPAFSAYAAAATDMDIRNAIVSVRAKKAKPVVRVSALELAARDGTGAKLGITYKVIFKTSVVAVEQPLKTIDPDGWVTLPLDFTPGPKRSYTVTIDMGDTSGVHLKRTLTLVSVS
jgi:Cellulase (glycosyl hydrolase family 5)